MNIIIANSHGRLDDGTHLILYPSRCDVGMASHTFSFYPFMLAYLSTLLKRELPEHNVKFVDGNHKQLFIDQYIDEIRPLRPDVLICECSALTYPGMTRLMQTLKQERPFRAILCGPWGMYAPDQAKSDGWDDVVKGEFEGQVLALIKGEPMPAEHLNIDWLPWPEDEDISRIDYTEPITPFRAIQIYASRHCPLSCAFCVSPLYSGGHGHSPKLNQYRNVDNVCDEMEYLGDKYAGRMDGFMFYEDTHNANVPKMTALLNRIIERRLDRYSYDAMCGYWTFNEELIALMARAGYKFVHMGIESLAKEVGKNIHKVIFPDKLLQVLTWLKQYGIGIWGTSLIGAPGSSWDIDMATLEALRELKAQGLITKMQYSITTPQPGTPFFEEAKQNGWLITDDKERYNWMQSVVSYPHYTAAQIDQMRGIYSRHL